MGQRALDGILPSLLGVLYLLVLGNRVERALHLPLALYLVDVFSEAHGETREISGAESRRLRDFRAHHGDAEKIRLELHEQVVA